MPHGWPERSPSFAAQCEGGKPAGDVSLVDLSKFDNSQYSPGRGLLLRTVWYFVSLAVFEGGFFPVSGLKTYLLRLFGARIGVGVNVKPHVRIKYPWRLAVGDHCWIGQEVWIDNLADVTIGDNVCISQRAYLCTGSHDFRRRTFDLKTRPIVVRDGAWLGAACVIFQGTCIGANAIVAGGSVVTKNVEPSTIVSGNPATTIARREPPAD